MSKLCTHSDLIMYVYSLYLIPCPARDKIYTLNLHYKITIKYIALNPEEHSKQYLIYSFAKKKT